MFAQRYDDATQLDKQRRLLMAAEEEKKTLNSLLRMEAYSYTKLEDLECDWECKSIRSTRGSSSGNARNGRPGKVSGGVSGYWWWDLKVVNSYGSQDEFQLNPGLGVVAVIIHYFEGLAYYGCID